MDRRKASKLTAAAAALSALAGTGWLILRAWLPWITPRADGRWSIGAKERFARGTATLLRRAKAIVVHDDDGLHAMSAICTHENCLVHDLPAKKEIVCPCHGSVFTYRGDVKRGPASAPLVWLALSADGDDLILDPAQEVPRS